MPAKSRQSADSLSSRERQIMDAVYRLGEATARDLETELPDSLANATIRTLLRILENKGHLRHREEGRTYVYFPARAKKHEAASALRRLLGVFYNGSVTEAFSGMLDVHDSDLSEEEWNELRQLIDAARKSKRGKSKRTNK